MPLDQTLALYRVIHAALDTECADESAAILSQAMRDLALHYKATPRGFARAVFEANV